MIGAWAVVHWSEDGEFMDIGTGPIGAPGHLTACCRARRIGAMFGSASTELHGVHQIQYCQEIIQKYQ